MTRLLKFLRGTAIFAAVVACVGWLAGYPWSSVACGAVGAALVAARWFLGAWLVTEQTREPGRHRADQKAGRS